MYVGRSGGANSASHNFNFQLLFMFGSHLNRLVNHFGEYVLDTTGPQMVATIKMSSFGYNLIDGVEGSITTLIWEYNDPNMVV